MRICKKRPDRSNTCLYPLLRDVRAARKRGRSIGSEAKDFWINFRILAIYYNTVRNTEVKCTSLTLALNTGYIQQI